MMELEAASSRSRNALAGFVAVVVGCGVPNAPERPPGAAGAAEAQRSAAPGALSPGDAGVGAAPNDAGAEAAPSDGGAEASADAGPSAPPSSAPARTCRREVFAPTSGTACSDDAQCVVGHAGCCPPCGRLTRASAQAHHASEDHSCNQACPACASGPSTTLQAECIGRRCALVETICDPPAPPICPRVRASRVLPGGAGGRCSADADCALHPKDCCHCGVASEGEVVAGRADTPVACRGNCPDCVSEGVDPSLAAACVAGVCRVRDLGLDRACGAPW
ncbi:MAG: hypothetical protein IT373_04250 [Polyangiaceae bacterium]|nr:hypothetical protein [Polyangiaceae bacterium]